MKKLVYLVTIDGANVIRAKVRLPELSLTDWSGKYIVVTTKVHTDTTYIKTKLLVKVISAIRTNKGVVLNCVRG